MFKNNFNLIIAPQKTWKSSSLHAFAKDLKSQLNKKIIFLGATHEFDGSTHFMNERYELYRFMNSNDENNMKTLQVIEELCEKGDIDFLFIDDIESFFPSSKSTAKKYVEFIDKIPVRKVATCNDEFSIPLYDYEIKDSKNYFLEMRYNKGRSYATINGVIANDFIKAFIRDEKIKTILE